MRLEYGQIFPAREYFYSLLSERYNSRIFILTYELESYPKKKEKKEKAFINYSCDGWWKKKIP